MVAVQRFASDCAAYENPKGQPDRERLFQSHTGVFPYNNLNSQCNALFIENRDTLSWSSWIRRANDEPRSRRAKTAVTRPQLPPSIQRSRHHTTTTDYDDLRSTTLAKSEYAML
jgi:hypothetical protein